MKLKQLLASALLLCSAGAWAQTDVTSTYITNADFSSTDGWTQDHSSQYWSLGNGLIGSYTVANDKTSSTDATHLANEYCFGIQCRWSTNYAAFTQTTPELPIGYYTLTYDVQNKNASNNVTYENRFKVTVGGNTYTDTKKEWMSGSSNWTTHTITFNVTEASTATISLGYGTSSNNIGSGSTPHLYVSHLSLTWTDPLKASKDALQAEIDKAKLCDAKEGLATAISTAEGILENATTTEELEDALAALQAADKDAVLRYDNGLADATALAPVVTSFVVNGTFDSNVNGWSRTGGFQNNAIASNQNGAFTVPFYENWNGSAKVNKMYQPIENIPNGTYRLDIAAFVNTLADPNESQYVYANSDKVYLTTGEPTAYEVYTVVTNNQIEIGLEQTTATANWMGIDNVSLRYYGAGDVINDAKNAAHKLAWQEALNAAEAAIVDDAYENVTGSERTALSTEIAKAEPSTADGYDEAATALTAATSTFTAAKAAYDAYANFLSNYLPENELKYATTAKYTAIGDAYWGEGEVANAADATARVEAALTALRAYYESHALAEKVEGAVDCADAIAGADPDTNTGWTGGIGVDNRDWEKYTDASGNLSGKYYDGGWSTSAGVNINMSREISLPAGTYLLTITARGSADLTSYTMSVGGESVDLPTIGSGENQGVFGHGWDDVSLEFESDGNPVTLTIAATSTEYQQWISFNRFRLVRLELNTDAYAGEAEYTALNIAIAKAEAYTLGFEDGQYAPYNNVAALEALAAAKAIDQEAELTNFKTDVVAATTALSNATWTANETRVSIIYNGMFATVAEGQNYPDGWTRTNGWGQMQSGLEGDFATAYYNQPGSLQYGNQGLYTMPLEENYGYTVEFYYRSHENNSNKGVTVSVYRKDNPEVKVLNETFGGNSSTSEWKSVQAYFPITDAGNYVLEISNNGNTWMTNVFVRHLGTSEHEIIPNRIDSPFFEEYGIYDGGYKDELYTDASLERSYKEDTWNTFVVPFDMSNEDLTSVFGNEVMVAEFTGDSGAENSVCVTFDPMATPAITANKPVLLKFKSTQEKEFDFNEPIKFELGLRHITICDESEAKVEGTSFFDFTAVYKYFDDTDDENPIPLTIPAGEYFIANNALYKSKGETTIKPFRAYMKSKDGNSEVKEVRLFIDGIETAISEINGVEKAENGAIFNIAGQRVNKAQKGLYIINGKKVIVK